MTSSIVKIFDHNLLIKNRNRSVKSFRNVNFVHHLIADLMLEIILDQKSNFDNILEISSLDNYLLEKIRQKISKSNIFSAQLSPFIAKLDNFCPKIIMNDEFISFKKDSFDLVFSNLNAHFYNDLLGFFIQSHHILRKKGFFIASLIANDCFTILKQIFNEVEIEEYQRFAPRFIPTTDIKTVGMLMQKAGFKDVVSAIEEVKITYQNPENIFKDVKNSASGNIMFDRSKKFMSKGFYKRICDKLEERKLDGKIEVNLNIIIVFGYK